MAILGGRGGSSGVRVIQCLYYGIPARSVNRMTDHDALLAAIIAYPDEDTPRLAFADWLQENDNPDRGEFIRLEVELARTPPITEEDERRRQFLLYRREELLKVHRKEWLGPFLPHARDPSFERGFIHSLDVPAHTFLKHAERWFAITPLRRVKFTTCSEWDNDQHRYTSQTEELFASPLLTKLEAIDLEQCNLRPPQIVRLAKCPDLHQLRELILARNAIGTEGAKELAGMKQLSALESLDLVGNSIADPGARAIAQSPYLGGLKELRITRNPIRKKSWTMLELRFGMALMG
jgi:uncharacterized protein (TIGR02996 family)